jgi:integrase
MALTDTAVRNAKPKEKPYKLGDSGGLYVIVRPTGAKWWRLKYRFAGKEKSLSVGTYPDVSLQDARRRRDEARQLLARGVNPSAARKATHAGTADNTGDSFETVAREWFSSKTPNWVPGHASTVLMRLERYVLPTLGTRSMTDIGPQDIHALLKPLEKAEKYETASRVLNACHQICDYALYSERITRNPAAPVKQLLTKPEPTHFAATTDPKEIGPLLRKLHGYAGTRVVRSALRLAALVFVRPGELRQARWADIDLDAAEWRFRVSKTKTDLIVPLAEQAVAILRALHPHTSHQPFVFPGPRNGRPMSENALAAAMRTMDIPKDTMSVHGFRAMARTCLDEQLGFPPHLIEHQLAHTVKDPLGRAYNRTTHLEARRRMMQRWADYLDELRTETTA